MKDPAIMYVCENCKDNNPEGCGRYDREEIRLTPAGQWLCDDCFGDTDDKDIGLKMDDEGEYPERPSWSELPFAPQAFFKETAA